MPRHQSLPFLVLDSPTQNNSARASQKVVRNGDLVRHVAYSKCNSSLRILSETLFVTAALPHSPRPRLCGLRFLSVQRRPRIPVRPLSHIQPPGHASLTDRDRPERGDLRPGQVLLFHSVRKGTPQTRHVRANTEGKRRQYNLDTPFDIEGYKLWLRAQPVYDTAAYGRQSASASSSKVRASSPTSELPPTTLHRRLPSIDATLPSWQHQPLSPEANTTKHPESLDEPQQPPPPPRSSSPPSGPESQPQAQAQPQPPASPPAAAAPNEPNYPSSFAALVDLITNNKPIPGIETIPNIVLDRRLSKPSAVPVRRKPWERSEGQASSEDGDEGREREGGAGVEKHEEAAKLPYINLSR